MKYIVRALFFLTTVLAASCSRAGIVHNVPVKFVRPAITVSQVRDTAFNCSFPEVLRGYNIKIVDDTVLVIADQIADPSQYCFKAYSINTFNYLGSFIRKGRGPGEMIDPRLTGGYSQASCIGLYDVGKAYMVDVEESLKSGRTSITRTYDLPSEILDWMPMPDERQFTMLTENNEFVYQSITNDGTTSQTFNLYKQADGDQHVTHLSSLLTNNGNTAKVAEFMLLFPQFNIMDTESGQVLTFAVDKAYRKWESILYRRITMDNIDYYTGVTSTRDYIFATYKGVPLSKTYNKGQGTSIHIFDWDGNFLYDIDVAENIDKLAFDRRTGYLYCHERSEDRIIRYDLNRIL